MKKHLEQALKLIDNNPNKFIAVVGPTCTGKTDLSLAIAEHYGLSIINADSRLIFRDMDIGTAKPSQEELARVQHHLLNIKSPDQKYSAGDYQKDFDKLVRKQNLTRAVVVGGTGFYIKAALEDLDMPPASRDDELRSRLQTMSLEALVAELDSLDPQARLEIDLKNKLRVMRAIEIVTLTSKPLNETRRKQASKKYDTLYIGLNFTNRQNLYDLINKRVSRMIEQGLVAETEALINCYGITETLTSTIGYKELLPYIEGSCSLDEACEVIRKNTRNYAKRQLTWFGANSEIHWLLR